MKTWALYKSEDGTIETTLSFDDTFLQRETEIPNEIMFNTGTVHEPGDRVRLCLVRQLSDLE